MAIVLLPKSGIPQRVWLGNANAPHSGLCHSPQEGVPPISGKIVGSEHWRDGGGFIFFHLGCSFILEREMCPLSQSRTHPVLVDGHSTLAIFPMQTIVAWDFQQLWFHSLFQEPYKMSKDRSCLIIKPASLSQNVSLSLDNFSSGFTAFSYVCVFANVCSFFMAYFYLCSKLTVALQPFWTSTEILQVKKDMASCPYLSCLFQIP